MKLLFVEDEPRIQEIVRAGLSEDNFQVEVASSAEQAKERMSHHSETFDAFLLDILLPGLSGLDLCRWLRELGHKETIILLTARGSVEDKVVGLDAGADDYLTKPFEVSELRARFRALSRKFNGYPREPMVVGDLVFDPNTRIVHRAGVPVTLAKKEVELLEYLLKNTHRVVSRSMIANAVWDSETSQYTNVIDVFVSHLRKKLDGDGTRPRLVHTVRGKGFRLAEHLESED